MKLLEIITRISGSVKQLFRFLEIANVELQYILEKEAQKRMRFENQSDIVELRHKTNGKEAQIS